MDVVSTQWLAPVGQDVEQNTRINLVIVISVAPVGRWFADAMCNKGNWMVS